MENKDYNENNEIKTEIQKKSDNSAVISYAEKLKKYSEDRKNI